MADRQILFHHEHANPPLEGESLEAMIKAIKKALAEGRSPAGVLPRDTSIFVLAPTSIVFAAEVK